MGRRTNGDSVGAGGRRRSGGGGAWRRWEAGGADGRRTTGWWGNEPRLLPLRTEMGGSEEPNEVGEVWVELLYLVWCDRKARYLRWFLASQREKAAESASQTAGASFLPWPERTFLRAASLVF